MNRFFKKTGDIIGLTPEGIREIQSNSNIYTESNRPVTAEERDWGGWNFAALWIGMLISIPVYMVASGLIVEGMTWYQALFTICLGHTIVMFPAVIIGHAGTKFGINFPMVSRFVFGSKGAAVASLIRALLGCFWFGVQCWIGGEALYAIFKTVIPGFSSLGFNGYFISFIIFWLINLYVTLTGAKGIKILENIAAPILIFLSLSVVIWSLKVTGGVAQMLSVSEIAGEGKDFRIIFFPALSAMIAFDGAIALSMPDFTRHAKSQRSQTLGQLISAPIMVVFISFVGVAGTAGSVKAFGEAIWNPAALVAKFGNPVIVILFSIFIIMAVLTTNVAANLVPPAMVVSTLFSKYFSYKKAVVVSAVASLLSMPWKVLSSSGSLIFGVFGSLGALLGPIAGIYMASYWFEHKTEIDIVDLYIEGKGRYYYKNGWNIPATVVFTTVGLLILLGKFWSPLKILFDNSYVFGMAGTGIIYYFYLKYKNTI